MDVDDPPKTELEMQPEPEPEGDKEALAVDSEGVMDRIDSVSGQIEELMALYRADTLPQEGQGQEQGQEQEAQEQAAQL